MKCSSLICSTFFNISFYITMVLLLLPLSSFNHDIPEILHVNCVHTGFKLCTSVQTAGDSDQLVSCEDSCVMFRSSSQGNTVIDSSGSSKHLLSILTKVSSLSKTVSWTPSFVEQTFIWCIR